jgi:hypothetical protein
MDEIIRPVAVAQRFLSDSQDVDHKEVFQAVARHFDAQFSTAAAAQQVISSTPLVFLQTTYRGSSTTLLHHDTLYC